MIDLQHCPTRAQLPRRGRPYDTWLAPQGEVLAEFYRMTGGYLLRFPGEVDFEIFPGTNIVRRWPVAKADEGHLVSLYTNAVLPILGNYNGGLFLHGSAAVIEGEAVAFLGLSRSGKTTLAAALAKKGHPLMTEDVIDLEISSSGVLIKPKSASLRLFSDSAAYLLGENAIDLESARKRSISLTSGFCMATDAAPLAGIYLLGQDRDAALAIRTVGSAEALKEMLRHSFILDVEDKRRLNAHFCRIADLCEAIPCYALDYPRRYADLDRVLRAIIDVSRGRCENP